MVTIATAAGRGVREAAANRRSIRDYVPSPVPRADLEAILSTAGLAPSAFNLQPWRFAVVENAAIKAQLVDAARRQRQVASAPVVIVLYADTADALATVDEVIHPALTPEGRESARASVHRAFGTKTDAEREAWGVQQAYIALGYLLLAAEELGYQTSPMLGFDPELVKGALGLPAHVRVAALVAIGYGAEDGRAHHRQPIGRIVRFV